MPSNFPVIKNDLFLSLPFLFFTKFLIFITFASLLMISKLTLFEKKLLKDFICVSPIPSVFKRISKSYVLSIFNKLSIFLIVFEINFADSCPICLIPKE